MKGMRLCIDDIINQINIDTVLIDGNHFGPYLDENFEPINHVCITKGDDKYLNIAAASIIAKEYDEYIQKLVEDNLKLNNYKLTSNKGYGTKVI